MSYKGKKICVIIPCYKVRNKINNVLKKIDFSIVDKVIIVDDNCPQQTGKNVKKKKKIKIIFNQVNLGVGGATIKGFKIAKKEKFDYIFKLDGDGQHNPNYIVNFINELEISGLKFCKGTRFKNIIEKKKIPTTRFYGNMILTYINRIICRNAKITDVVNGFFLIEHSLLKKLSLSNISQDFFFEQDLLFNIFLYENNISEIPIKTLYFEESNLKPLNIILPFIFKHIYNFFVKITYDINR